MGYAPNPGAESDVPTHGRKEANECVGVQWETHRVYGNTPAAMDEGNTQGTAQQSLECQRVNARQQAREPTYTHTYTPSHSPLNIWK